MMKEKKEQQQKAPENTMSRKEALKKMGKYGKYAALTALGTYVLLNPKQAQAASTPKAPGFGF